MKWKYLCLKTFKMGIYALEFMHFFIEKVLSGFALSSIKFWHIKFFPFSLFAEELSQIFSMGLTSLYFNFLVGNRMVR